MKRLREKLYITYKWLRDKHISRQFYILLRKPTNWSAKKLYITRREQTKLSRKKLRTPQIVSSKIVCFSPREVSGLAAIRVNITMSDLTISILGTASTWEVTHYSPRADKMVRDCILVVMKINSALLAANRPNCHVRNCMWLAAFYLLLKLYSLYKVNPLTLALFQYVPIWIKNWSIKFLANRKNSSVIRICRLKNFRKITQVCY